MDLSEKKIDTLKSRVDEINYLVESLCGIREDIFETRKPEWLLTVQDIKINLESDQMLLFIGPFSSGKSTFVNALLGVKDLLPTADRPCTSIITELVFKRGGGHTGKAVRYDKTEEIMDYAELIKMIDGPRGAAGTIGQYHHIELAYDVSELDDLNPLRTLENLNVRIVDCPGYGSIYRTNEEAINEYIQRANFTFWMNRWDKLGGATAEHQLSKIQRKTTTLISIITMADLADEAQLEQAQNEYYETLGTLFRSKEPRFVSAVKWQQAQVLQKELVPDNPHKEVKKTKEERAEILKKIDVLRAESGVDKIFEDMVVNSQTRSVNEANLRSALDSLVLLFKDLVRAVDREEKHWEETLKKEGWSPDNKYKKLTEIKSRVEAWIQAESEKTASNLETFMTRDLIEYLMEVNGKVDSGKVQTIITKIWNDQLLRYKDDWAKHFASEYHEAYKQFANDPSPMEAPDLGKITDALTNLVMSVLESFKEAGLRTVGLVSLGAVVVSATPAISGIALVGGALSGVAMIAGSALILVAAVPLLPAIFDKVKQRKEQYRKEIEARLREWMQKMDIAPSIAAILTIQNEKLYQEYRDQSDLNLRMSEDKYERCKKIKTNLADLKTNIADNFPEDFKE
jgi:GTP-binding protein EngB required for normal cell division